MAVAKIAITIERDILSELDRLVRRHVFPNRSRAIQEAVGEKVRRLLDRFKEMRDGRGGHGLRHRQPFVLACATVAVMEITLNQATRPFIAC